MTASELVRHLEGYATSFSVPLVHAAVRRVERQGDQFVVATDGGSWLTRSVVVATGYAHRPTVPAGAAEISPSVLQLNPLTYKNPDSVAPGGVLVVGASSSGAQIAAELRRAGHDVVLAVGRHTRLPRRYRGDDVLRWFDRLRTFDRTIDELPPGTARSEPSLQLVGGAQDLDLGRLHEMGVQIAGRFVGIDGSQVHLADDLAFSVADADRRLRRVLTRIDSIAGDRPETPVPPLDVPAGPVRLDLASRGIGTVVWATGFRGAWPWLHLPVVQGGRIVQHRGRTAVPGLYTVGQRFQHRRSSTLIDGARHDVADVVSDLVAELAGGLSESALRALPRAV